MLAEPNFDVSTQLVAIRGGALRHSARRARHHQLLADAVITSALLWKPAMRATLPLLIASLCMIGASAAKAPESDHFADLHESHKQRQAEFHEEMKHLRKIKSDDVDDWTVHKDVDDTYYFFSRTLKRSQKEAPKGWTKTSAGMWKAPPRKRDEL